MSGRQPETTILRAVRAYLETGGWFVIRNQAGLGTLPGLADLQAIRDSRVVMIECKTPTGRLSEAQWRFAEQWRRAGGEYIVARSTADVACLVDCLDVGS